MMMNSLRWLRSGRFFAVVAVLTAVFACLSIQKRIQIENKNRSTLLVAEFDTVAAYAAAQQITVEEAIPILKAKGLGGLVVAEQTIGELITDGKVVLSGVSLPGQVESNSIAFVDVETVNRVKRGLTNRFGKLVRNVMVRENRFALPPIDLTSLKSTSVGLEPAQVALAKKFDLTIVGRFSNPVGISTEAVKATVIDAKTQGMAVFLAQGEQVLGRRDATKAFADALVEQGVLYASPEFAKLGGDANMLEMTPENVIRLHSAQAAELDKLSMDAAIERYRKAASERNMRILLLRGVSSAADQPLTAFADFIGDLRQQLLNDKIVIGQPKPFVDPGVSKLIKIGIGLFGGLALFWTLLQFRSDAIGIGVAGFLGLITLAGSATNGKGLQIAALLLTLAFPVGAFIFVLARKLNPWLATLLSAFMSMIGGLCVAGLLNGIDYYIRAEAFIGVKVAVFLPVLVIGVFAFAKFNDLKTALKEPITYGAMVLGIVILGVLGLMIMRTGNDNPNAVSGGEIAFRDLLETLLPVRPRTKEFLIGFPALFIGFAMLATAGYDRARLGKVGGWVALTTMLGGIALTDIINTLCHLHTPVKISVIRNLEGLVLGAVFGALIWLLIRKRVTTLMATTSSEVSHS